MRKSTKRLFALTLALTTCLSFTACKKDKQDGAKVDVNYEWLDEKYTDTSDLSTWDDKQLSLKAWNNLGTGMAKQYESSNDVVWPEIKRVTGVRMSSIVDNQGSTADIAIGKFLATNSIPDISFGEWVDKEYAYDLTELVNKYCPTIMSRVPASVWKKTEITQGEAGKIYAIPYDLGSTSLYELDPKADPVKTRLFNYNKELYPYIYVREDILKDAYPNALTTDDISRIYDERGSYTEEEVFDIGITSAKQFRTEFLPKIYNAIHNTKKNGKYVYQISDEKGFVKCISMSAGSDQDTWDFLGKLIPMLIGAWGGGANDMFSYWDKIEKKVKLMINEDFYMDEVKEWVDLIKEGKYLNNDELYESNSSVQEKYNNGEIAIGYLSNSYNTASEATVTSKSPDKNGTKVKYRKVYLKIPLNEHVEALTTSSSPCQFVSIMKDSVNEKDLPQILRWLDYQYSELADKLYSWGPRSAGLFEESVVDGEVIRQYVGEDAEDLKNQMVYNTASLGEKVQKYNLWNGTRDCAKRIFSFVYAGGSRFHAKCYYDLSGMKELRASAYNSSNVKTDIKVKDIAKSAAFRFWQNSDLDGIQNLWGKRKTVEFALQKLLDSGNNFKSKREELTKTLRSVGWQSSYWTGEFTDAFLSVNEEYLDELMS